MSDRHRYDALGGKCRDCSHVYSNPVHRQSRDVLHQPLTRSIASITPEEMVDALLDVRLGCEGDTPEDQRRNTRYYAERLLARLSEAPLVAAEYVRLLDAAPSPSGRPTPFGGREGLDTER